MSYNHITQEMIAELARIAGERNVILDPSKLDAFSHDETSREEYGRMPEVVLTPQTTAAVAEIVKFANRYSVPITPRGAGSGL